MKAKFEIINGSISVTFGNDVSARLERNPDAHQKQPRCNYVYAHLDERGTPFYIGRGVGRSAWNHDRHPLWHRYVEKHLKGNYQVVVLEDNLTHEQAEEIKSAWMAQESETLVNWCNMSRQTDFKAIDRYHMLRKANLSLVAQGKATEKTAPQEAVTLYRESLERVAEYASIQAERGLVGQLINEERAETGLRGELQILDRLTLCLVRLGRDIEASEVVEQYFANYRADLSLSAAAKILKRVNKAPVTKTPYPSLLTNLHGGPAMNFVAIDVETANADMASICQIGLVKCARGVFSDEWRTYVDPEDYFDDTNISIHGIDSSTVKGAPTFPELADKISSYLSNEIVVCHTHFDRVAMQQATHRYGISTPECTWLDSARVARRTWTECAWKGYGLYDVCKMLGHEFSHHDALQDAKAAAHILLAASNKTGLDINGWLKRVRQPIGPAASSSGSDITREGNPEGALNGEVLVFTGALQIPRGEAADLAAGIGCQVESSVTKKTTLLVVGDQDIKKLAGHEKSSKHRKAEDLMEKGVPIRILKESDFKELVRLSERI